jgi:hypothetical protein
VRPKKRKKIPNPNARFITMAEILATGGQPANDLLELENDDSEDVAKVEEEEEDEAKEAEEDEPPVAARTRSGR